MLIPFLTLAARSPSRQRTFRRAGVAHLVFLAGTVWAISSETPGRPIPLFGQLLLVAGIVEGAMLVGWRLTQLPKSQALEFVLVSPLRPHWFLVSEAFVGLLQLGWVTLSGLPVLLLLVVDGRLDQLDLLPLLVMPCTWGAVTGLGLTVWAYEPLRVRFWGERVMIGLVLVYLLVGVLAAENLKGWLDVLPSAVGLGLLRGFRAFHLYNPFGALRLWMEYEWAVIWEAMIGLQVAALLLVLGLLVRAAWRLQGHFHEWHYQPVADVSGAQRPPLGEQPLRWWAVKRVSRYSGRINLWLAGGFGLLYALYLVAGPSWPAWLGRRVFEMCDGAGGVAGLTTALVLLAAVPAAFQYGLWDSSVQDRCRRLELLLLTELRGRDYWDAAAAAAWRRGRGYFAVALLLWGAALLSGRLPALQVTQAVATGVLLWALYFTLGFRAFARGMQANSLGTLLTVGLPLLAWMLARLGGPGLAVLLPPGLVYSASASEAALTGLPGSVLVAIVTLLVAQRALAHCDANLRCWYDQHQGVKVMS
jgi:hypothetical protein